MQTRAVRLLSLFSDQTNYNQKNWSIITDKYTPPLIKQKIMNPQVHFNDLRNRRSSRRQIFPIKKTQAISATILLKSAQKQKQSHHLVTNHKIFSSLPKKNYNKSNYTLQLIKQQSEVPKQNSIDIYNTIDLSKTVAQTQTENDQVNLANRNSSYINLSNSPKIEKIKNTQFENRRKEIRFRTKNSLLFHFSASKKNQIEPKHQFSIKTYQKPKRNHKDSIINILLKNENSISESLKTVSRDCIIETHNLSDF